MSDFDFDSILNAGIAAADAAVPVKPVDKNISPNENKAYEQLGYQLAAERESLGDDYEQYGSTLPEGLSTTQLAALSRGMSKYYDDANAMYDADAFDNIQSIVGGVAEGAFNTGITTAAAIAGGIADLQAASVNSARRMQGLPEYAHNYLGDWATASAQAAQGFGNLFRNAEEEIEQRALAANRAARERKLEQQYQEDRARGMSAGQAGFRDLLRGFSVGIENVLDSPTQALNTFGQAAGQLGFQGAIRNVAGKLIGANAKSAFANRALEAVTLGVTEGASSIGDAANAIDKLTDDQLFKQSPEFAQLYQEGLLQGKSKEQASKDARTELKRQASLTEALLGGASAMVAGAAVRPLERLGSMSPFKDYPRDVFSEALEEAITGAGQGFGSNIAAQQTYDPNKRLTEGVGAQISEGALGGGIAAAGLRAPGTLAYGSGTAIEQANKLANRGRDELKAHSENAVKAVTLAQEADKAQTENSIISNSTLQTTTEDSVSEEDTVEMPIYELKNEKGEVSGYKANDLEIDTPYLVSVQDLANAGYSTEKITEDDLDAFKLLDDSNVLSKKPNELTDEDIKAYTTIYDALKRNVEKNIKFQNQVSTEKNFDLAANNQLFAYAKVMQAGILGQEDLIPKTINEQLKAQFQELYKTVRGHTEQRAKLDKITANRANKALKHLAKKKDLSSSDRDIQSVLNGIAAGVISTDNKILKHTISKIKENKQPNELQQRLVTLTELQEVANKAGISLAKNQSVKYVRSNLFAQTVDTKIATTDLLDLLSKAIASGNKRSFNFAYGRLKNLAISRKNKLKVLQDSLRDTDDSIKVYETYSSKSGKKMPWEINLGSLELYDSVVKEQKQSIDFFNQVSDLLDDKGFGKLANNKIEALDHLENEEELKQKFRDKYGTNISRSTPRSSQSEGVPLDVGMSPTTEEVPVSQPTTPVQASQEVPITPAQEVTNAINQVINEPVVEASQQEQQEVAQQPTTTQQPEEDLPLVGQIEEQQVKEQQTSAQEDTSPASSMVQEATKVPQEEDPLIPKEEDVAPQQESNPEPQQTQEEQAQPQESNENLKSITIPEQKSKKEDKQEEASKEAEDDNLKDFKNWLERNKDKWDFSMPNEEIFDLYAKEVKDKQAFKDWLKKNKYKLQPFLSKEEIREEYQKDKEIEEQFKAKEQAYTKEAENLSSASEEKTEYLTANPEAILADSRNTVDKIMAGEPDASSIDYNKWMQREIFDKAEGRELRLNGKPLPDTSDSFIIRSSDAVYKTTALQNVLESGANEQELKDLTLEERQIRFNEENFLFLGSSFKHKGTALSYASAEDTLNHIKQKEEAKREETRRRAKELSDSKGEASPETQEFLDQLDQATAEAERLDREEGYASEEGNQSTQEDVYVKIEDFVKAFTSFANNVLHADKKTAGADGWMNLADLAESFLKQGKSHAQLLTGIKDVVKDKNGKYTYNADGLTTERLLLALTQYVKTENGMELVFNQKALTDLALATMQVMQNLENEIQTRSNAQIDQNLAPTGLDSKILTQLSPKDQLAVQSGIDRNRVIQAIANKWMDFLGLSNNPYVSPSFNGEAIAKSFASLATQFLEAQGYIHSETLNFVKTGEDDAGNGTYAFYPDAEAYARGFKFYGQEHIPVEGGKGEGGVTLNYIVPTLAYKDRMKELGMSGDIPTVSFIDPQYMGDIDTIMSSSPEKQIYASPDDMPEVSNTQLRSNVPLTPSQKKALMHRRRTAHYLDADMLQAYMNMTEEGIVALSGVVVPDLNVETAASVKGRREGITREYRAGIKRAIQTILWDPKNPRYYGDHTEHRGGRAQELSPNGDQASKLIRYLFSNVKSSMPSVAKPGSIQELELEGFKRAVLQAFGVKVRDTSVEQTNKLFDQIVQAMEQNYSEGDYNVASITKDQNTMKQAFDVISKAMGGKPENIFIGMNASINMMRFMKARETGESFTNTLPLEHDGSCNGFAMSHLRFPCDGSFTKQSLEAEARSHIYKGRVDYDPVQGKRDIGVDNYTANANATSAAVAAIIRDLVLKSKLAKDPKNPDTKEFPELRVHNTVNGKINTINPLNMFQEVMFLISTISQGSISVNSKALEDAINEIKDNPDEENKNKDIVTITRLAIKFPTTRINYGQGKAQNGVEIWGDLSADLSAKISLILQHPEVPPYRVYFEKELKEGLFTEDVAFAKFQHIGTALEILNNYAFKEDANGTTYIEKASAKDMYKVPLIFKLKKDETIVNNSFTETFADPNHPDYAPVTVPLDPRVIYEEARTFVLKNAKTSRAISNFRRFYADAVYDAVDKSRSEGFKEIGSLMVSFGSVSAMCNQAIVTRKINQYVEEYGFVPSLHDISQYQKQASNMFPTVAHSPLGNISMASETYINIADNATGNDLSKINMRPLRGGKVQAGPFEGQPVASELYADISARVASSAGIAPVATTVIGTGDGYMQTELFLNDAMRHISAVDRYDGVDIDPKEYYKASQYINKAVYDIQSNFPTEAILNNITTFVNGLEEANQKFSQEDLAELGDIVHKQLLTYSPDYKQLFKEDYKQHKGLPNYEPPAPSFDTILDWAKKNFLAKAEELHRNAFINTITSISLPTTMAHMSAGPEAYHVKDPRDTFYIPEDLSYDEGNDLIVREANRRRAIIATQYDDLWEHYKETGELRVPDEVFKNPVTNVLEGHAKPKPEKLVGVQPTPILRALPNTRKESDREIGSMAELYTAPKRDIIRVQPVQNIIKRAGRIDEGLRKILSTYIKTHPEINGDEGIKEVFKRFFVNFINNNLNGNLSISLVKRTDLPQLGFTQDLSKADAFFDQNSSTIYLIKEDFTKLSPKDQSEVVLHELIHAISLNKIEMAAKAGETPEGRKTALYKSYKTLKDLRHAFEEELRNRAEAEDATKFDKDTWKTYQDTVLEDTDSLTQTQEFVAYMMTQPELIEIATKAVPPKKLADKLMNFFTKFFNFIKSFFGLKGSEEIQTYLNFWSSTAALTSYISTRNGDKEAIDQIQAESPLAKHTRRANDPRLDRLAAQIEDTANAVLAKQATRPSGNVRDYNKNKFELGANREARIFAMKGVMMQSYIPMTEQEILIGASLADLYSIAMEMDSSPKLDAMKLRDVILDKLKVEDLALPSDGSDSMLSQLRYEFLTGYDKLQNMFGENVALGLFMGMAATSSQFRSVLDKVNVRISKKDLGTDTVVSLSDSTIDTHLSNFGYKALQVVNDYHSLRNPSLPVKEQLDAVVQDLLVVKKEASALSHLSGLISKGDEFLSDTINRVGTKLIGSDTLHKWIYSDNKLANYVARALQLSVPFLLKQDNKYYLENKQRILEAVNEYGTENPSWFSRLLTTAHRELLSTDENADAVQGFGKEAKAGVQAARSNWREVAPRIIKQKFADEKVELTKEDSAALDGVILRSDLGALSKDTIHSVLTGHLVAEIGKRKNQVSELTLKKAKELAHYMTTGIATNGMLRNPEAISAIVYDHMSRNRHLFRNVPIKEDDPKVIDELVTLLALQESLKEFKTAQRIYKAAPKAFTYAVDQQRQNRQEEKRKALFNRKNRYNYYKGYYPQDTLTKTNVQVVPVEQVNAMKSLGYDVKGYNMDKTFAYMKSSLNPMSTFNQGGLQSIINQTGGIDEVTGFSPNTRVYKRIKGPKTVAKITATLGLKKAGNEAYMPILDETGTKVIGYEISVNPEMYRDVVKERDFANNLGAWKGRQVEEDMAAAFNESLINEIKRQWEEAKKNGTTDQFVDLIELGKKDPIIADALQNLSPKTLMALHGNSRLPEHFYVRNDLVPDIIGRRQASVVDLKTGISYWTPEASKVFVDVLEKVAGKRAIAHLYRAESVVKSLVASARNFIVVRSGEVMVFNLLGNIVSLSMRGVPITEITRLAPRIVKELENYNHSRQRQVILEMEINAEKGKDKPNERRLNMLENKLAQERATIDQLTYSKDLLKAGEYNTIADLGDVDDDILLSTGKWGEYVEKKVDNLPDVLKEGGRQALISKDTSMYRMLEKGTQYGDFVAKAILYHYLRNQKKMKPENALSKVRYEFVNYDMLPGRTREYLENIGLLWFYNYKLRITRTFFSMVRENPLSTLLSIASPVGLGIGTPVSDNFLAKLITNPFGSVGPKIFDFPWITSNFWFSTFS